MNVPLSLINLYAFTGEPPLQPLFLSPTQQSIKWVLDNYVKSSFPLIANLLITTSEDENAQQLPHVP